MSHSTPIKNIDELREYLAVAIQLEHATIPPYLTALYSIKKNDQRTNFDAASIIRTVLVEEMLHLTLAANVLNAVGGSPDLLAPGFIPPFPTYLPSGQDDFKVGLEKFSPHAMETFLNIERPAKRPERLKETGTALGAAVSAAPGLVLPGDVYMVKREELLGVRAKRRGLLPTMTETDEKGRQVEYHFHSIGDFYNAIVHGIKRLSQEMGEAKLFTGGVEKQIGREYFYSGGGEAGKVTDEKSAIAALLQIADQGEGYEGSIYDNEGELSHYYRFQQIGLGQFYLNRGDKKGHPTGETLEVHWDEVFPIIENAKIERYPEGSDLRAAAVFFNDQYRGILGHLTRALNGEPKLLEEAVGEMYNLRYAAERLMNLPMPDGTETGAPTFEI